VSFGGDRAGSLGVDAVGFAQSDPLVALDRLLVSSVQRREPPLLELLAELLPGDLCEGPVIVEPDPGEAAITGGLVFANVAGVPVSLFDERLCERGLGRVLDCRPVGRVRTHRVDVSCQRHLCSVTDPWGRW